MPHAIKAVAALPKYQLRVHFRCGETKICDLNELIESLPLYKHFLVDEGVFNQVAISEDGYSVYWNEYVDCGCEILWMNGKKTKGAFDTMMSCADAALIWRLDESTLRKAILAHRFVEGTDVMKFGKQWIITEKAMTREFGLSDERRIQEDKEERLQAKKAAKKAANKASNKTSNKKVSK